MVELRVRENQTPFDVAIEAYGSVEGVFQLMEDNPWINLEEMPEVGKRVIVTGEPINKEVAEYLHRKKVSPANGCGNDPFTSAFSDGFDNESFE